MMNIALWYGSFLVSILGSYWVFVQVEDSSYGLLPSAIWLVVMVLPLISSLILRKVNVRLPRVGIPTVFWIVFGIIFLLRMVLLTQDAFLMFHGDEAIISKTALETFEAGLEKGEWNLLGYQRGTISDFPALWYYLQGAVIYILGPSLFSVKIFSLVIDFLILLIGCWLVKSWYSNKAAVTFGLLYATFPVAIHFGMIGYQNLHSTFFLILAIALLEKLRRAENSIWAYAAGIVSGVSLYFYLSSVLIPIIAMFGLVLMFKKEKIFAWLRWCGFYMVGLLFGGVPFASLLKDGHNFVEQRSTAYDFWELGELSAVVSKQAPVVLESLHSTSFNGSGKFYIEAPFFGHWLLFVLFLIGACYVLVDIRKDVFRSGIALFIIFLTIFVGGVLTDLPPASQRMLHTVPFVVIVLAILIDKAGRLHKVVWGASIFAIVLGNVLLFYRTHLPYYYNYPKGEYHFAQKIREHDATAPVFVLAQEHKIGYIFFYTKGMSDPMRIYNMGQLASRIKSHEQAWLVQSNDGRAYSHTVSGYSTTTVDYSPFERMYLFYLEKD